MWRTAISDALPLSLYGLSMLEVKPNPVLICSFYLIFFLTSTYFILFLLKKIVQINSSENWLWEIWLFCLLLCFVFFQNSVELILRSWLDLDYVLI